MKKKKIRIGTRGSKLAMWQAEWASRELRLSLPDIEIEIVTIKTKGDIVQNVALAKLPGKAFFTKEIEEALLSSQIDLAVHSGKDVPTEIPQGLALAGFSKRHPPADVLISKTGDGLKDLKEGSSIGTSSLRRRALVANFRADLKILDLRGNVDTRLRKLDEGLYDAIVLAGAGVERLGLGHRITERLDTRLFPPAVSQGAMALEIREGDKNLLELLRPLLDQEAGVALEAERSLLKTLEGGCQVPLGALATLTGDKLTLKASIIAPDGSIRIDDSVEVNASQASTAGVELAKRLLEKGGDKILGMVRQQL